MMARLSNLLLFKFVLGKSIRRMMMMIMIFKDTARRHTSLDATKAVARFYMSDKNTQ